MSSWLPMILDISVFISLSWETWWCSASHWLACTLRWASRT